MCEWFQLDETMMWQHNTPLVWSVSHLLLLLLLHGCNLACETCVSVA
jgi:hypothetical protein